MSTSTARRAVSSERILPRAEDANLYSLAGGGLHVTFTTTGIRGGPHLTYQDIQRTVEFDRDEIEVTDARPLGTIATVTLNTIPDAGSTTFSLLIPKVRVDLAGASGGVPVDTKGIIAHHKDGLSPILNLGQIDHYSTKSLRGSASFVLS